MELSGRHRTPHESVQIIKTCVVPVHKVVREHAKVYSGVNVKFPKVKPIQRAPSKSLKSTFKAHRSTTI